MCRFSPGPERKGNDGGTGRRVEFSESDEKEGVVATSKGTLVTCEVRGLSRSGILALSYQDVLVGTHLSLFPTF